MSEINHSVCKRRCPSFAIGDRGDTAIRVIALMKR